MPAKQRASVMYGWPSLNLVVEKIGVRRCDKITEYNGMYNNLYFSNNWKQEGHDGPSSQNLNQILITIFDQDKTSSPTFW